MADISGTCFYVHCNRCYEVKVAKSFKLDDETPTLLKV